MLYSLAWKLPVTVDLRGEYSNKNKTAFIMVKRLNGYLSTQHPSEHRHWPDKGVREVGKQGQVIQQSSDHQWP